MGKKTKQGQTDHKLTSGVHALAQSHRRSMQNRKTQSQKSGKSVKSIRKQDGGLNQIQDCEDTHQPLRDRVPQETRNEEDRATPHYVYRPESTGTNSSGN